MRSFGLSRFAQHVFHSSQSEMSRSARGCQQRRGRARRMTLELLELRRLMAASQLNALSLGCGSGDGPAHAMFGHDHVQVADAPIDMSELPTRVTSPVISGQARQLSGEAASAPVASDPVLAPATMTAMLHPLSSIPALNSYAGAPVSIYLDFNGHTSSSGGVTPVYDADGDATTFSDQELQFINNLWRVTAEDFAPFNINVTTIEPSVLAAGVPTSAANGKALRLAIGGTGSAAGLAQYNSFTNSGENLAWVYAQGKTDAITYGHIASHEAGHSFGLRHQVAMGSGGWNALMYLGLANQRYTWTTGLDDQGAVQDDMAMITSPLNGITYRADDHAGSVTGATPLVGSGTSFAGAGIIGSTSDADVFMLPATGASVRISVAGDSPSQNLDAVLELLDAAGNVLARNDPADSPNASIAADSIAEVYVAVRNNGQYGRLGQYTITVEASAPGVTVSSPKGPFTTSESGRSTWQTLVLNARPAADVIFNVASSDATEGVISTGSVVFTPANWFIPQTVTVAGVGDGVTDGASAYSVAFAPAQSADPSYSSIDPPDLNVVNLDDAPGNIYWLRSGLTHGVVAVDRATLAGDAAHTVLNVASALGPSPTGSYDPSRIAIDPIGGKMYWNDLAADAIYRANLDGSSPQAVVTGLPNPLGIAIDPAGKLYWVERDSKQIQRANLDGSAVEDVIATGLSLPGSLDIDPAGGKIYWNDVGTRTINRANLDGTGIEVVYASDGVANPSGNPASLSVAPASGKIYFGILESTGAKIYRSDLDGSQVELLVDLNAIDPSMPNRSIRGISIDSGSGRMFWSDSNSMRLFSADLDGSNIAVVFEGTSDLRGIAVLPATPGFTVTPTSGLSTTEAGGTASFTVVLNAPPTADVTIPVATSDASEGTASVSSLTFTPFNWNTPQTITVTGVDDAAYDQDVAYTILLGTAASGDARYQGLNPADVSAVNRDNDAPSPKFYVVDDASQNRTYEYDPNGALVESYSLNSGNAAPRGAAGSVAGDKTWVVDANRKVFVYNTSGGLLGSWTASTLASNATVEGLATNGTDVWIVDARSDKVFRYAGGAARTSGSQTAASSFSLNSGNLNPKDIVTDGQYLWVVNDAKTDKVFKYTVGGSYLGSWTIDAANKAPTGLTIDPANPQHIWIVDSGTDRIYQYSSAVGFTSGSRAAASSFALAAGNTNPQGIADPPAPGTLIVDVKANAATRFSLVRDLAFTALALSCSDSDYTSTWRRFGGKTRHSYGDVSGIASISARPAEAITGVNPVMGRTWAPSRRTNIEDSEQFAAVIDTALTELACVRRGNFGPPGSAGREVFASREP